MELCNHERGELTVVHTSHIEQHFTDSATIRDLVIGMSDGLTVPFALAAGLAGAVDNHWLIVIAGASEIAARAVAMGVFWLVMIVGVVQNAVAGAG